MQFEIFFSDFNFFFGFKKYFGIDPYWLPLLGRTRKDFELFSHQRARQNLFIQCPQISVFRTASNLKEFEALLKYVPNN